MYLPKGVELHRWKHLCHQSGVCTDWVWLSWQGCHCCWLLHALFTDCSIPASKQMPWLWQCFNIWSLPHNTPLSHAVSVSVGMMFPVWLLTSAPCTAVVTRARVPDVSQPSVRSGLASGCTLPASAVSTDTRPARPRPRRSSDNPLREMLIKSLRSSPCQT